MDIDSVSGTIAVDRQNLSNSEESLKMYVLRKYIESYTFSLLRMHGKINVFGLLTSCFGRMKKVTGEYQIYTKMFHQIFFFLFFFAFFLSLSSVFFFSPVITLKF